LYETLQRDSGVPLYLQLSEILRQRIVSGVWNQAGYQLPTEPELCAEFDVARGTVRQALSLLEKEGYVRRERGRGTFVDWTNGQPRARSEAAQKQIGFVVPYVRDSFMTSILLGVERRATERGMSVIFRHVENDPARQKAMLEEMAARRVAGTILYPTDSAHMESIAELIRAGSPVVLIDRYMRQMPSDYVMADHFGGALQVTQHLIALGHTRIGYVSWDDAAISMEHRAAGYRQALLEAGLPHDEAACCEVPGYPEIPLDPLRAYLTREPRLTAVFAANDQIALAVYRAARNLGLRVPEDLALVGFGDIDLVAHLDVPLTTVVLPTYEIGSQAVDLLLARIHNRFQGWQRVILPTQLVIRRSCGAHLENRQD
jgi:GntR family transcriptional regulator, arabinose operon transcriptional repressor